MSDLGSWPLLFAVPVSVLAGVATFDLLKRIRKHNGPTRGGAEGDAGGSDAAACIVNLLTPDRHGDSTARPRE